jgi:Mg-chelatase subunit ChlD
MLENIPNIPKLLENTVSKKNKDIVFALDYSESMNQPGRLQHATKAIVTV